jgi:hypothetical protein
MDTNKEISRFSSELDELQHLLEKQLELAQQGGIGKVEVLSKHTGSLVEKISQTGIFELAEFKNRREQLQKLYHSLCLALMAQRAETAERLSLVHKGKKAVKTYRKSI